MTGGVVSPYRGAEAFAATSLEPFLRKTKNVADDDERRRSDETCRYAADSQAESRPIRGCRDRERCTSVLLPHVGN